uniref:Uncharacterized protein n=1 Tax=Marseillevirus LCMAC101 TaxID=2506602 RepID=A0A481YRF1_9VIRU|nr:MAG: hypothetical protein LCMAC101_04380 [Marseillevirus LCMAC101]
MNELHDNFILFVKAYDNYNLSMKRLIHNVISLFNYTDNYDYDSANREYKKFLELINKYELYGTTDLCDPIHDIYHKCIKPNI